jgi:hypothetical protein
MHSIATKIDSIMFNSTPRLGPRSPHRRPVLRTPRIAAAGRGLGSLPPDRTRYLHEARIDMLEKTLGQ